METDYFAEKALNIVRLEKRDISAKGKDFLFLSGKARKPLKCGHNIPLNSSRLNGLKVEKN